MVKKVIEILYLPVLSFIVFLRESFWQYRVQREFYSDLEFEKKDKALLSCYKKLSPYKIAKSFSKDQGESNIYTFGSTPLHVYHEILRRWIKNSTGSFLELGSGTGRGLVFLNNFSSCKVDGIEWNSRFVNVFQPLMTSFNLKNIRVFNCDYRLVESFNYDWIYFYEFFLSEKDFELICDNILKGSMRSTKIITVSYPISDYHPDFESIDSFKTWFPWGRAEVFLSRVKLPQN